MKQLSALSIFALLSCLLGVTALAGPEALPSGKEMKQVAPAPEGCDFVWTGFYIGVRAGYGWNDDNNLSARGEPDGFFDIEPEHQGLDSDGFIGGVEYGRNWQLGRWFVVGLESDFSGSAMRGRTELDHFVPQIGTVGGDAPMRAIQDVNWISTTRGRIGFVPFCRLLIYGTGGAAMADLNESVAFDLRPFGGNSTYPAAHNDLETGWTAGGGIEWAVAQHWTLKVEYLYYDFGDHTSVGVAIPPNPPFAVRYNWDAQFHSVVGGLNYKF